MKLLTMRSHPTSSCTAFTTPFAGIGIRAASSRPPTTSPDPKDPAKGILSRHNLGLPLHSCLVFATSLSHNVFNGPPNHR
jgi:hypothetical protein